MDSQNSMASDAASPAAAAGVPTIPETYLRNCTFIGPMREGQPPLFRVIDDVVYASIDGYTIIPTELYEQKLKGATSPVAPAGAPTGHRCLRWFEGKCLECGRSWGSERAGSQGEQHDSSHEAAPQSSVPSASPLSSLRATGSPELPREPSNG